MSWSFGSLRGLLKSNRRSRGSKRAGGAARRLLLEPLETRRLLADDCLAAISGTVFTDLTDDGLTNDDLPLAGAMVSLYRDGGNGSFEGGGAGDDALVGTMATNASGEYRFDDLVAGRYFVEQQPVSGQLQRAGQNVVLVDVSAADALGTAGTSIDSFETAQSVTASSTTPLIDASAMTALEAIGGERDLYAELTSGMGNLTLVADAFDGEILEFMASSTGQGVRLVTWDGPDMDATNLDATGLRLGGAVGQDLTQGDLNIGLQLFLGADQSNGIVTLRVFTDAGNASAASVSIPNTGGVADQRVVVRFTDFNTIAGQGADFTNVGAIQLEIEGVAAVDGQIDLLGALRPTVMSADFANLEPLSLGNLVWLDSDNSGTVNGGEQGISGVVVNLLEDTDGSGTFTPGSDTQIATTSTDGSGIYGFDNLFPGAYFVQVDPQNFAANGPLEGLQTSTGNDPVPDPNNGVDNDDNGASVANQGLVTRVVNLEAGQQFGGDGNLTVDFGVVAETDLSIVKTDSPDPVGVGNVLTYSLAVTNNGPATATGVTVTDVLPTGVSFQSANATQGSFSESNGTVTFVVGTLADGGTATLTVVVTVDDQTVGTISNTAEVTGNELDPNPDNNTDTQTTTVTPRIDLAIVKTDTPDPVIAGNTLTYTLQVTNNGPSDATNVQVTDTLPAGVTFVSATTPQGTFSNSPGIVTFDLGDMAQSATLQLTVTVDVGPAQRGMISNTAQVTADETEIDETNNTSSQSTTINAEADLVVVKTESVDPVVAGEQLVYTLSVTNQGPSQATAVVVTDTLPAGVSFVQVSASQGTASEASGVVTANLGNLAPNGTAQVTVTVLVDAGTTGSLTNTAVVDGDETDPDMTNNEDQVTTTVEREVDLVITKTDAPDPVIAGNQLVYTVNVSNNGPSDASGVTVVDTLPSGVTFVSATSNRGSAPTHAAGVVTANVGDLADGESAVITITVSVGLGTEGTINNSVTVSSNETEVDQSNNTATQATVVSRPESSIGGVVFLDWDDDGVLDSGEMIIRNVTVTLTGTDASGGAVSRTQTTGADGSYLFDNLMPGTYRIDETQPPGLPDGKDVKGTPDLGTAQNDAFVNIVLPPGIDAINYNFAERPPLVSKLLYLASTTLPYELGPQQLPPVA